MNIREFRFLADENIDKELVLLLREDGLDFFKPFLPLVSPQFLCCFSGFDR
jgi:hypothetical protein